MRKTVNRVRKVHLLSLGTTWKKTETRKEELNSGKSIRLIRTNENNKREFSI